MSKNVSSFISKIDKLYKDKITAYLPSRDKTLELTPLTIKQQKDLISSILDGIKGSINFNKTLNQIIIDCSGVDDLKLYEKVPIIIELRKESLGKRFKDGKEEIDITRVIKNIKNIPFELEDTKSITVGSITVNLAIPTLKQENVLLNRLEQDISSDDEEFRNGIALMYIVELLKYIVSIEIEEDVLDLSNIRISERIDIVERLPLKLYNEIASYIEAVTKYNDGLLTVDDFEITIDSNFFDTSASE